ncbi:MAG: TonB family protein [Chloroherpetonaceae bacterium]|nr:TonB family protein [Chloroherpetonaceae bacterium]
MMIKMRLSLYQEIKLKVSHAGCFLVILLGILLLSNFTELQAQGRIMGQVIGTDGNPVSGATVFISSQQATQATISNAQGYYVFLSVPEGTYEVKATRRGLPNWKSSVQVQSAQTHRIDMKLGESPSGVVTNAVAVTSTSVERKREEVKPGSSPQTREKQQKEERPIPAQNQVASSQPNASVINAPQPKPVDNDLQLAVEQAQREEETLTQMENGAASMDTQVDIIGGMTAVYKNITYPRDAERTGIQGQVIVRVYIAPQGVISRLDVMKSPSKLLSDEVVRVLTEEVQFTPATSAGKPVIGIMTIPIMFKLKQ